MEAGDFVDADVKRPAVFRRLEERREAREKAQIESTRHATKAAHEEFLSSFNSLRTKFLSILESARENQNVDESDVESASSVLHELQTFLNGSLAGLPAYRIQQLQNELDQYYLSVTELRQNHLPKKRFGFRKIKPSTTKEKPLVKKSDPLGPVSVPIDSRNYVTVSNKTDEHLELDDMGGKDVLLSNLTNCKITICGTPATLHVTHFLNCELFTGPVRTSIFVDSCVESTLHVACQQLRIHSSRDCKFHTYVSSRAIIEDCKDVGFGPYGWDYPGIERDFEGCGFLREKNNWLNIDDFNWLVQDKASPNWRVLGEAGDGQRL